MKGQGKAPSRSCGRGCRDLKFDELKSDPLVVMAHDPAGPMQVHLDDLLARQGFGPEPEARLNGGDGAENAIDGLAGVDQRQQNELETRLPVVLE